MQEHIVAAFDSDARAETAARSLEQIGIPAASIRRYRGSSEVQAHTETHSSGGGFWSWLLGEEGGTADLPSYSRRDSDRYDENVGAGRAVLAVTVADDSKIHRALELIEAQHPLEIEEETDEAGGSSDRAGTAPVAEPAAPISGIAARTPATGSGVSAPAGREETIPLAEEELEVGKRVVDRGTTRIRRYVVETPVERQVTLRGERVTVERRQPATGKAPGAGDFEERTVEVRSSEEEPVVRKNARVAEEVVVHREDTERQATVRDKVRRDEVEVTGDQTKRATKR